MESISNSLLNRNYSNGDGGLNKSTIAIAIEPLSVEDEDRLVDWAEDLIDQKYRLWFIKRLKQVGRDKFVKAATAARRYDGESRQRVFAHLLK